jgi:hypothetical protein
MRTGIVAILAAGLALAGPQLTAARPPHADVAGSSASASIRRFFGLIDSHRVSDAVAMMDREAARNASARAAWARQFSAIASIQVRDIRPSGFGEGGPCPTYKVTLDVHLSGGGPSYGWGRNPNLRWVKVCPAGGDWRVSSIGTGP